jgi:hypothetical protein
MPNTADSPSGTVGECQSRAFVFSLIGWCVKCVRPALEHAGTSLRTYALYVLRLMQPSIAIPLRHDGDTVHYQLWHGGRPGAVHSEVRPAATYS